MSDKRRGLRGAGWVVLVAAVGYSVYGQVSTQVDANQATEQKEVAQDQADAARQDAKEVADPLADLCRRDEEVRRRVGDLCDKAAEVQQQPTVSKDGRDGRGISATDIADGRLLITYTDGVTEDKGPVVGQGVPGKDGRSILTTTIRDGALVLTYSDGATENVGQVVGADGADGKDGDPGRGIASVTISADYRLVVTYTDGETVDAGPLPAGPPGRGIATVAFDLDTCTATVTYTDGVTEQAPMTGCPTDDPPDDGNLLPIPGG